MPRQTGADGSDGAKTFSNSPTSSRTGSVKRGRPGRRRPPDRTIPLHNQERRGPKGPRDDFMNVLGTRSRLALAGAAIAISLLMNVPASAQVQTGLNTTAAAAYGQNASQLRTDPAEIVGYFIRAALSLVGLVFMVLIVYGGFLWMTASGKEQQVDKAKSIITSAVIGMVVIAAGYALTSFAISALTTATTGQTAQ